MASPQKHLLYYTVILQDLINYKRAKDEDYSKLTVSLTLNSDLFSAVLAMINTVYHDNPLIFIGAVAREMLVSHHRAVNIHC